MSQDLASRPSRMLTRWPKKGILKAEAKSFLLKCSKHSVEAEKPRTTL